MQKLKYGPYSPSRLETATCPYAFHKQYVLKKESSEKKFGSLPQERGSALHEVLEHITKKMVENKTYQFTSEEVRTWVAAAVTKYPVAYQEVGLIMEMARLYIEKPPRFLTTDAQTELRLAIKWSQEENRFVECDYDDPDTVARGRADIFMISDDTTTAFIIDHKSQPNIEPADTFQLGFYAWVIFNIYPFLKEIRTVLHFTRYGYYSEEYIWSREQLALIEDEVLTRIAIIENTRMWNAIPHKNCVYCPFLLTCPVYEEAKGMDNFTIFDTEKAIKLAGMLNVNEEANKHIKSSLKQFVNTTGPIAIPGKVFENRATEGINWEKVNLMKPEVCEIFHKHGVNPIDFMSFNQTASKSIWIADNDALIRELSERLPRKTTTEFSGFKI